MEMQPPGFLQNLDTHDARLFRASMTSLLTGPGVINSGDLDVTQRAAGANMSVDVAAGAAWTGGWGTAHSRYYVESDAVKNVPLTAAHATLDRIDAIVLQIEDSQYSGVNDDWVITKIDGTPSGSPVPPTIPDNYTKLAQVSVIHATSSVVNANISNKLGTVTTKGQQVSSLRSSKLAIQANYASVTTNGSGIATITYENPFPSTVEGVVAMCASDGATGKITAYAKTPQALDKLTLTVYDNGVLKTSWTAGWWYIACGT